MCEQCEAGTVDYGLILPNLMLVRATRKGSKMDPGDWGLVFRDDPWFIWSETLTSAPNKDYILYNYIDENTELYNNWINSFPSFSSVLENSHVISGYKLVYFCIHAGYDIRTECFSLWLANHIGTFLKSEEYKVKEKYYEEQLKNDKSIT